MKTVELDCGVKLEIDEQVFDDMELLDALAGLEKGEGAAFITVTGKILTPENKKMLYDALRNDAGRVPSTVFAEVLGEIIRKATPKNT